MYEYIRRGTQKFLELLKKIKAFVKVSNFGSLRILPLRQDAAIPAPLPTEMLSKAASESLAAFDSISVEDFRQYLQHRERCWDCCIQSQEEYFEGD